MAYSIDDGQLTSLLDAPDSDCMLVVDGRELRRMCADILDAREQPVVALTLDADGVPVLGFADVRAVVGAGVHIYLIAGEDELLHELRATLGAALALDRGAARVWWPGAGLRCDPADHPLVLALEDEPRATTLEEFALQFDLSRPRVREQIRLIEDARAFVEHELAGAREQSHKLHERLRDAQIEIHSLRTRAQEAQARPQDARRSRDRDQR
jgi:hypothetical protein